MFSEVFSNLLKDDNIEKALITGILNFEQAGFSSELNNIVKFTLNQVFVTDFMDLLQKTKNRI